jgi:hypothetical protein
MLPSTLPLFPLPSTVLFPGVYLPLHIFESRYRQMLGDSLSGDRLIGMTLLQPGYEADYEGQPPIYPVGCSGVITHVERLGDGRFNIILRGHEKFRVVNERAPVSGNRAYRLGLISAIEEPLGDEDRVALRSERRRLEEHLAGLIKDASRLTGFPDTMPDADLVNTLAQYLDFDPLEKQALLERPGALERCRAIVELLEMKALLAKGPSGGGGVH